MKSGNVLLVANSPQRSKKVRQEKLKQTVMGLIQKEQNFVLH